MIRSGILEITDKQSVVLLSAIAMAMDLQEDAAPTDKQTLAMEVREDCCRTRCLLLVGDGGVGVAVVVCRCYYGGS